MSRAANPFRPGAVLGILAVGAVAFLLLLYALGQGWTGGEDRNGGEHGASNALTGFAGLAGLLKGAGHQVELSRSPAGFGQYGLLVLTPPLYADADEIAEIIEERASYGYGPTLLVLPKWEAYPVPERPDVDAEKGWVLLNQAAGPQWFADLQWAAGGALGIGTTRGWNGFGQSGDLPQEQAVQALVDQPETAIDPLVVDSEGDLLAGILPPSEPAYGENEPWPVVVVFEPDLLNNYGLADRARAQAALDLVEAAMDGETDMPVMFDLTLPGLGRSENLLTLAFAPPFLAATWCLLLAALVIAWRAFKRFGAPRAEAPAMAQGKRQLAHNGAALLERVKRWHLLTAPYATIAGHRIAGQLGIREPHEDGREAAVDLALERRGLEPEQFTRATNSLRAARKPREIIRAASALKAIERNLKQ